jgi:hypothetical protein
MDKHVQSVVSKILQRSLIGKEKYGTNLERKDLSLIEWLRHAQEESMDFSNYLEVIINTMTDRTFIETISLIKFKIEKGEKITDDEKRVFLIALNKILNDWKISQ